MHMQSEEPRYWFPAKRFGLGWGMPRTWQGWVVMIVFLLLMWGGTFVFSPKIQPLAYYLYCFVLCMIVIAICFFKGEPLRWRWGK